MKNVVVLFGGMSPEHEVSCSSAASIVEYLDRDKFNVIPVGITKCGKWKFTSAAPAQIADGTSWMDASLCKDVVLNPNNGARELLVVEGDAIAERKPVDVIFSIIHGETGEDGKLSGFFELAGVPYVGSNVPASAVGMDKELSYMFAEAAGLRNPMTRTVMRLEWEEGADAAMAAIETEFVAKAGGYPVFAKPASTGSSVGVAKCKDASQLRAAIEEALKYGDKVVLEENIVGDEIKVSVLGNDDIQIGSLCKLNPVGDFNDYSTKYVAHSSEKEIPANLSEEIAAELKRQAEAVYRAIGCAGFARVDFFLKADGTIVFNEINTVPGFTKGSIYPLMFADAGVEYPELLTKLVELALE